jgi:hypothetical protein
MLNFHYCLEIHNGTCEKNSEVHWRLGPVAAIGSHMESKVANIDSDLKNRNERVYRVVFGTRKCKYEER